VADQFVNLFNGYVTSGLQPLGAAAVTSGGYILGTITAINVAASALPIGFYLSTSAGVSIPITAASVLVPNGGFVEVDQTKSLATGDRLYVSTTVTSAFAINVPVDVVSP
jgi:acyl dehydratase